MKKNDFISQMSRGADAMKVHLDDVAMDRLFVYYTELDRWNRKVNLVSRKEHDWIRVHFLDSMAALGLGLLGESDRIVDLGAGAGFPGVPLRIAHGGVFLGMAEASAKKCVWLNHLARALELDGMQVMQGRFEESVRDGWEEYFDTAVSRAAAKPWKILELARPFLAPGGRALIYTTQALVEKGTGKIHPYSVPGSKVPSVIWEVGFESLESKI